MEAGPLHGLSVLDLSTNLASAYTSLLFADYGAEVVQVERPGGSPLRGMAAWPFFLRGKKSVVLDLHDTQDLEVARTLAAGSDVVIEAFGPGAADELGLAYDALKEAHPGLVYTSITGFGPTGAYAHLKAYEAVVMAKTGSMYGNVAPGRPGEPVMTTPFGATFAGALLAIQGTLLALHERETSGLGQRVDATMVQGMLAQDPWSYFMRILAERYPEAFNAVGAPTPDRPVPTSWLGFGLLNGYTKDGHWLQFAHATPRQFEAFVHSLGLAQTRADPKWKDAPDSPDDEQRDAWWTLMLDAVRSRTADEWQEIFAAEPHVFAEVYRRGRALFDHPQIVHDHHIAQTQHKELGRVREMGVLVKLSETPGVATRSVPALDEHADELRARKAPAPQAPEARPPVGGPALEGIIVVDLGTFYAGPFASAMLADQGATVIKIEPLEGDPIRFQMPVPESSGVRVTQGKKSVAIDVFNEEGHTIVAELIRRADLVLHTYRGGVAERMGLDADAMRKLNPNLVYHHGVGYGVDGPFARSAALAPTIAAGSGWAVRCGGGGPEELPLSLDQIKQASVRMGGAPPGHPDGMAALGAAVGMLLGLYARDRGAGGQVTLTSMISTMGHVLADSLVEYAGAAEPPVPDAECYGFSALYRLYAASDGWIVLCVPDERDFDALVAALPADSRLGSAANDAERIERLSEVFRTRTADEWERQLSAADLGCAAVVPSQGGLAMGLFEENGVCDQLGMLTRVTHPVFDEHIRSTELVRLSRSPATLGAGCAIGQHTDEVLAQLLDFDSERLARLRADGIIGG